MSLFQDLDPVHLPKVTRRSSACPGNFNVALRDASELSLTLSFQNDLGVLIEMATLS